MHALIIEDDYLIGQLVQEVLGELGFTSFSFARSEDGAVAASKDQVPNLITADVRLLPGDGVDAVMRICANRTIPVVFITGYADDLEGRVAGAVIVAKPIKEDELRAAVKAALAGACPPLAAG